MADLKKEFYISINGVKESVTNLESLESVLSKMEKQVESINKNGGFSVVSKEANKNTKEAIDLAKAEEIAQNKTATSYKEKQKALSTLGKEIKTMVANDDESIRKQQELIQQYNGLNDTLKRFDASMGNHQRNVGDYRGALKEATQEIKSMQGEMANMLMNGIDKADPKFQALAKKAGEMQDAISDARQEISRFASDTKQLDDVINIAQSATAAFTLYKGAMSAFGIETKGAEEAIQQLAGAMSIIQSLQTLQNTLKEGSATAKLFQLAMKASGAELVTNQLAAIKAAAAQEGLTKAQKVGAVASKTLGLALKAIPLMLVISLVTELVLHWQDVVGWFNNTFPVLKRLGGAFNVLKAVIAGVGKAIVAWITNPLKTMANVIKKIMEGDFKGAVQAAAEGLKNQFQGVADAFRSGFQNQVEKGLDDMAAKAAETANKTTKQQLAELKIQERHNKTYSKKYIDLQKKDFEERRKMAKGNKEELDKIKLEEMQFFADVEDKKTQAAKSGASERTKAAKETAKVEEDLQKKLDAANKNLSNAFYQTFQIKLKEQLRQAGLEVEKYAEGPLLELVWALEEVEKIQKKLFEGEKGKSLEDLFAGADENIKKLIGSVDNLIEREGYLSVEQMKLQEKIEASFNNEEELEAFRKNLEAFQESVRAIVLKYKNDIRIAHEELFKKIAEGAKKTGQAVVKNTENIYKNFLDDIKKVDVTPVRNGFTGLINEKETAKKFDAVREQWIQVSEEIQKEIQFTEGHWDEYIRKMLDLYGEDSQKYKDAVQEKIDALKKLQQIQDEVNKRAATPLSLSNDYNADGNADTPKYKKLWYGKGETDRSGKEYSFIDNMANMFQSLDEMVLAPAMDTFSMYMDFAIEETQRQLEIVEDLHDEALDKVSESADKIKELNDSLKDSSNTNLEMTKQQLADEQLLYAQRLAEEQKLAEREKDLKNKANEQEYQSRMMELRYQLIMGIANTAQGASKALADWGWPLGPIFAGVMAALGAVQTGIIMKQLSSLPKPRKLADGGIAVGPSHAEGGIPVGRTGVEIEGGEAIINKKSTSKYLPLLDAINAAGNGGKHTLVDKKIRKFANGGTLNFDRVDNDLRTNANTNRLINAIEGIDFQPQVAVTDINRVNARLTKVKSLAGR